MSCGLWAAGCGVDGWRRAAGGGRRTAVAQRRVQLDAPLAEARREERQHALHAEGAPRERLNRVGRALRTHQSRA